MATIASLLIELGANVARLQQDMDRAGRVVDRWSRHTESSVSAIKTAFAGLGVAIGVGSFVSGMQRAIDKADGFDEMAQKIGASVEAVSELTYAFDRESVSQEAAMKGLKTLASTMFEASQGGKEAVATFKGMGVEFESMPGVLRATDQVLLDLAERFANMRDGPEKAALAVKLFGKAGMDMIPFLNQGRTGIAQLREEARRLGVVVSTEAAASAAAFNDNLRAVRASGEGLMMTFANKMLPSLTDISKAMKLAAEEGGVLKAVIVGIGGAMSEMFSKSDEAQLRAVEQRLANLRKEWTTMREAPGGWARNGIDKRLDKKQAEILAAMKEEEEIKARIVARDKELAAGRPKPGGNVNPGDFSADTGSKVAKPKGDDLAMRQWAEYEEGLQSVTPVIERMNATLRKREELEYKWGRTFDGMTIEEIENWERRQYAAHDALREIEEENMRVRAGFDENGNAIRGALDDTKKTGEDVAKDIGLVFQSAASDAIREWKGFKNLLKSVALDIAQMMFKRQVVDPLAKGAGALLDAGIKAVFGGARADGGPVMAGRTYLVGERGPELFTPGASGGITPNHALGGGGVTVVQNISIDSRSDRASILQAMSAAKDQAKAEILASMQRGGTFARA